VIDRSRSKGCSQLGIGKIAASLAILALIALGLFAAGHAHGLERPDDCLICHAHQAPLGSFVAALSAPAVLDEHVASGRAPRPSTRAAVASLARGPPAP
jgi:hypothetical protein